MWQNPIEKETLSLTILKPLLTISASYFSSTSSCVPSSVQVMIRSQFIYTVVLFLESDDDDVDA